MKFKKGDVVTLIPEALEDVKDDTESDFYDRDISGAKRDRIFRLLELNKGQCVVVGHEPAVFGPEKGEEMYLLALVDPVTKRKTRIYGLHPECDLIG